MLSCGAFYIEVTSLYDLNMEAEVIREFIDFFQEFLVLSESKNWPKESTSELDIKDAYEVAGHVEKCVDKFQELGLLDEFLDATLREHQQQSRSYLRECFTNPSRTLLKKIINSKTSVKQVEVGIKLYLEIYSEDMLNSSLANLFVETASKETLIRNLTTELTEGQLIKFQTKVFLFELITCNEPEKVLKELLDNTNQDCLEILIISLLDEEPKYINLVRTIEVAVKQKMLSKKLTDKDFWKHFFFIRDRYFRRVCEKYESLFNLVCGALFDIGKLFKAKMSMEFFYNEMTYDDFAYVVQTICEPGWLREKFIITALQCSGDPKFWDDFIQEVAYM